MIWKRLFLLLVGVRIREEEASVMVTVPRWLATPEHVARIERTSTRSGKPVRTMFR